MPFSIRKSTLEDLPAILRLRDAARLIMRKSGNYAQWPDGYPPEETFRHDIAQGVSYLIEDLSGEKSPQPVATFAFVPGPDPTYSVIYEGQWISDALPYYVIHRMASLPDVHGILDATLRFCFSQTTNIRIDTHRDNVIMRHLLIRHGFAYCGIIHLANGDERLAYQKQLSPMEITMREQQC